MAEQPPSPPGSAYEPPSPPGQAPSPPSPPLVALMRSLSRPSFRKAFVHDPLSAVDRTRLDLDRLPPEQLEVLARLSDDELEVVADVVAQLREANPAGRALSI